MTAITRAPEAGPRRPSRRAVGWGLAAALLTAVWPRPAPAQTEGLRPGEGAAELVVSARTARGRPVERLQAAEVELSIGGEAAEVLAITPLRGEAETAALAAPWRLVVYFDLPLLTRRSRYRSATALAERAAELTTLGAVAVVVGERGGASLRLAPSRDPKLVANVLAALARDGSGEEELAALRGRYLAAGGGSGAAAGGGAATVAPGPAREAWRRRALAAAEAEAALVEDRLGWLPAVLTSFSEGKARALLWITDGFDSDPAPFYLAGVAEPDLRAEVAAALRLRDPGLALEAALPGLAAAGWVVVPVALRAGPAASGLALEHLFGDPLAPLVAIAAASGGRVVPDSRHLGEALADLWARWRVVYRPPPGRGGEVASIELRSRGREVTLRGPRWGLLEDAQTRATGHALALFGPAPRQGEVALDCRVGAGEAGPEGGLRLRCGLPRGLLGELPAPGAGEAGLGLAVVAAAAGSPPVPLEVSLAAVRPGLTGGVVDLRIEPPAAAAELGVALVAPGRWGARRLALPRPGGTTAGSAPAGQEVQEVVAATAAWLPEAAAALYLVPPRETLVVGRHRVVAQVLDPRVASVTFWLDDEAVATDFEPPFEAALALGAVPEPHVVRATAADAAGRPLGGDAYSVNLGDSQLRVRIVEPRALPGAGEYAVRLAVEHPPASRLERVELYWNEERLATFAHPPYTARLTVPAGATAGFLRATAATADGATAEDVLALGDAGFSAAVEVDLVELFPVVVDRFGRPVPDLGRDDFEVLEEGRPQPLLGFARGADEPLTVGLVLDLSTSVAAEMPLIQRAARRFLTDVLRGEDRAFLVGLAQEPSLLLPPSGDFARLARVIGALQPVGATALYDTTVFALMQLSAVPGRKAIVLLTDGDDTASRLTYRQCLAFARRSGVPVYVVGLGALRRAFSFGDRRDMLRLARGSGGDLHLVAAAGDLEAVYAAIAAELRSQYLLTFRPRPGAESGFRRLEVRAQRPGVEVRAAEGYFFHGREP